MLWKTKRQQTVSARTPWRYLVSTRTEAYRDASEPSVNTGVDAALHGWAWIDL